MRPVSRRGASSASATVIGGRLLSLAMKWPWTWQQRMRTSQHDRRVGSLGQLEAVLDRLDDRRQIGARVEQPDLDLHGEGMAALLHDRGAFAIILADDDQRAAGDAARGEIGQRVGGDIGADRRLEGAAPRIG